MLGRGSGEMDGHTTLLGRSLHTSEFPIALLSLRMTSRSLLTARHPLKKTPSDLSALSPILV